MKKITFLFLILSNFILAQKPCEYATNVTDSIGTYKVTKEDIICEKNFAGTTSYIFFSLALTDGLPTLNVQLLQKSKAFMKANCFDKNSRLFLQLNNGKIISLLQVDSENCGSLLRDDKGFDNRILSGSFVFPEGSIDDLKSSPVSMMRIGFATATEDYVLKKQFLSELDGKIYQPEKYFVDNLNCVLN